MASNTAGLQLFTTFYFLVTSQQGLNVASYLAGLKWFAFQHCPKVGTAERDRWLLGRIAAPSALICVLAIAVTSFCLPRSKTGNGVLSFLLTLSTLKQQSAMHKLVRLHDQESILNWLLGYDAVAFQLPA